MDLIQIFFLLLLVILSSSICHTIFLLIPTLRKQFCQINKNILLVFMRQNSFVVPTKHFAISIKFWLLKQNVSLGQQNVLSIQQKMFCCIHFFLSEYSCYNLVFFFASCSINLVYTLILTFTVCFRIKAYGKLKRTV